MTHPSPSSLNPFEGCRKKGKCYSNDLVTPYSYFLKSEFTNVEDDSTKVNNIEGLSPSDALNLPGFLPWTRRHSLDLDLNVGIVVRRQSVPQISPKSRDLDLYFGDQSRPGTQSSLQLDSKLFLESIPDPIQPCNNVDAALPHRLSPSSYVSPRDSDCDKMDTSPDSGIVMSLVDQASWGEFPITAPEAVLKDARAKSWPALDQ